MGDQAREIFGWTAAAVSLVAYVPYIVEYIGGGTKTHPLTRWMWRYLGLKGNTDPKQSSWLIWAALQLVIFQSSVAQGVSAPALIALGYLVGSSTNAVLLFKYGKGKWELVDYACAVLAAGSLFLLYETHEPFWALALAIVTDGIGAVSTLKSVTKDPTSESRAGWTMFLIGGSINLLTIKTWSFQEAGYTVYLIVVIGYVCARVWLPKLKSVLS